MVKTELGIASFRAHGLTMDDLKIWVGPGDYNFTGIDSVYDYALSIGIRPLVEISYTPWGLTGHCTQETDAYNASICPPVLDGSNDRGNLEYGNMVKAMLSHLVERYGVDEIRKWQFEFYNEPNGMQ